MIAASSRIDDNLLFFCYLTAESGERLSSSESLSDLNSVRLSKSGISWKVESPFVCTPPGTPPPPYHGDKPHQKENLNPSPPVPPPPDDVRDGHREEDVRWSTISSSLLIMKVNYVNS